LRGESIASDNDAVAFIFFENVGYVLHTNTDCDEFAYEADTWYHFELRNVDFEAFTYDFYVDGELVCADVSFAFPHEYISQITLSNYDSGNAGWDNIAMW